MNQQPKVDRFELMTTQPSVNLPKMSTNVRSGIMLEFVPPPVNKKSKWFNQVVKAQLTSQNNKTTALIDKVLSKSDSENDWIPILTKELRKLYPQEELVETFLFQFGANRNHYIRKNLQELLDNTQVVHDSNKPKLSQFLTILNGEIKLLLEDSQFLPNQIKTMLQDYKIGLYSDGIKNELEQIAKNYPALGEHNPIVIDYNQRQDGVLQLGLYEANRLSSLPCTVFKTVSIGGYSRQICEKVPEPIMDKVYNPLASFNHRAREVALREILQKYFPNLRSEEIKSTPTEQITDEVLETDHFSYLFEKAYQYLLEAQE
jgi:hypothetical protein